jgi:thiazole synthase
MWKLADRELSSRLILGTARYDSPQQMLEALRRAGTGLATVSLRRTSLGRGGPEAGEFFALLRESGVALLPNTASCRSVKEAVTTAQLARELLGTHWIKLETIGDEYTLQPDPFALVEAARILVAEGFEVFPYMTEDLVVADRLVRAGCRILMPWGAPIGSGRGLANPAGLRALRRRFPEHTIIVDAGIGAPSHAAQAMELGCDGVLLNTAVARASDPPAMAEAFAHAVRAGHLAYRAGIIESRDFATPSTPTLGAPFGKESRP